MKRNITIRSAFLGAAILTPVLSVSTSAYAVFSIDFGDFGSPAPSVLTQNGDAALTGGVLRLTPDQQHKSGSAFLNIPFDLDTTTSFSSHFQFRIHGQGAGTGAGADGLVFIVQNDPRGTAALGRDGSGLGYGNVGFGGPPIVNSVGIAFDTYPFQQAHQGNIEMLENGEISFPAAQSLQNFDFASGEALNAWVDYSGATDLLRVYLSKSSVKPTSPLLSTTVAIENIVGSRAFFGFSGATGDAVNIQDINNWALSYSQSPVPEPSPAVAFGIIGTLSSAFMAMRKIRANRRSRNVTRPCSSSASGVPPALPV